MIATSLVVCSYFASCRCLSSSWEKFWVCSLLCDCIIYHLVCCVAEGLATISANVFRVCNSLNGITEQGELQRNLAGFGSGTGARQLPSCLQSPAQSKHPTQFAISVFWVVSPQCFSLAPGAGPRQSLQVPGRSSLRQVPRTHQVLLVGLCGVAIALGFGEGSSSPGTRVVEVPTVLPRANFPCSGISCCKKGGNISTQRRSHSTRVAGRLLCTSFL